MPDKGYGCITKKVIISRSNIDWQTINELHGGWEVMYSIELPGLQMATPTGVLIADVHGTRHVVQLAQAEYFKAESQFQMGFVKWNDPPLTKEEEKPCPRCSYPFPDPERMDREV